MVHLDHEISKKSIMHWNGTSIILVTFAFLAGCQDQETPPSPPAQGALTEEEREKYRAVAQASIEDLAGTLGSRLQEAIQEGGPVSAVKVCQEVAQPLTRSVTEERPGITIKRTALRYRNPQNAPDETDREVLQDWQARKEQGEILPDHELIRLGEDSVRYYKPIMLQPICLNCHGPEEQLLPELKTVLDELYPEDQARNFQVGELRGVFRVDLTPEALD